MLFINDNQRTLKCYCTCKIIERRIDVQQRKFDHQQLLYITGAYSIKSFSILLPPTVSKLSFLLLIACVVSVPYKLYSSSTVKWFLVRSGRICSLLRYLFVKYIKSLNLSHCNELHRISVDVNRVWRSSQFHFRRVILEQN